MTEIRPTHPGAILREDILPELGMTPFQFADALGLSRETLDELLAEKCSLSPDLAHRLGHLLGNGPALWLSLQAQLDAWNAEHINASHEA